MNQANYVLSLKKIRNAYIFLLFNINIGTINLLPEWIAFILIRKSLEEISKEEESAQLLKGFCDILCAYHFILWILNIFTFNIDIYLITIFFLIIQLYLSFQLMSNIIDISMKHQSAYTNKLTNVRNIITILFTISSFPKSFDESSIMFYIMMFILIIWVIVSILQIIHLNGYINEEQEKI